MVSIIIPVWNSARYLRRCISSIIGQTYHDWELILINDGSTDNSEEIINEYLMDGRIKLYSKENGGVSSARNYGITLSSGEYILFLDSDDWLAESTCEILMNIMSQKRADCLVFGINQTHGKIWAPECDRDYLLLSELKKDLDYWLNTELLSPSIAKVFKRDMLTSLFPPDMSFGEDLVFNLTYLSHCSKVSFIGAPLYQHEVFNSTSITHSFNNSRFVDVERIQKAILDFGNIITTETYRKYCSDVIRLVRMLLKQETVSYKYKKDILNDWRSHCYYRTVNIESFGWPTRTYVYAKLIQLGYWDILITFHKIKTYFTK